MAARVDWPGTVAAGLVADARLVSRHAGSKRGTVRLPDGSEALVDRLPASASEGASLRVQVTRAALAETGRLKRARAIPTDRPMRPAPPLEERLAEDGDSVHVVRGFAGVDWDELAQQAWDGSVPFAGGSLVVSATPAMTVIDIDGTLHPRALALAAVPAIAATIRRFDLAGSIAIDFPSLETKADRKAVDAALDGALAHWPHERTAMNGFGLIQLVSRLENPSLLHRFQADRAGAAARMLLRRAEAVKDPGPLLLVAHPAVEAALCPEWRVELERRTGRPVRVDADPGLALTGGFAQALSA